MLMIKVCSYLIILDMTGKWLISYFSTSNDCTSFINSICHPSRVVTPILYLHAHSARKYWMPSSLSYQYQAGFSCCSFAFSKFIWSQRWTHECLSFIFVGVDLAVPKVEYVILKFSVCEVMCIELVLRMYHKFWCKLMTCNVNNYVMQYEFSCKQFWMSYGN